MKEIPKRSTGLCGSELLDPEKITGELEAENAKIKDLEEEA